MDSQNRNAGQLPGVLHGAQVWLFRDVVQQRFALLAVEQAAEAIVSRNQQAL
jgi:hypothetical protein